MPKPLTLSIALCLVFTSCQVFEKSRTWDAVVSVRPGESVREPDPSSSYADKLHRVLLEQGVEHIVVTYQYRYYTYQSEEALGTRTAVIYRDDSDQHYPWWLKDDRTENPIWLPNGGLDQQVSFYCRRTVTVIEKKVYPARGGSGKAALALYRPAQAHLREHFAERPQTVTKIAATKPAPVPSARPMIAFHNSVNERKAAPATVTIPPAAVTRIQRPPTVTISKLKPASEVAPSPAAAIHTNPFWAPRAVIDSVEQASDAAPRDEHLESLFHIRNGTSYDPASAVDRRKMEQLKHGLVGQETSDEEEIRRGVDGPESYR